MGKYLNRTDYLLRGVFDCLKFYLCLIFLMFGFRLAFLLYFGSLNYFENYLGDIFQAFFIGWKYDSIVASYFLLFFILILPFVALAKSSKIFHLYQRFLKFFFIISCMAISLILISDLGFYSFFQDHINILFFGVVEDDTEALFSSIQKDYPIELMLIGYGIFVAFLFVLKNKVFKSLSVFSTSKVHGSLLKFVSIYILIFILLAGSLRGGYGDLVISPKYTDFSESEFVNQLSFNGVIALEDTIKLRLSSNEKDFNMTEAMGYGNDIKLAFNDYLGFEITASSRDELISLIKRRTPENKNFDIDKVNVVVILMESFGSHWLQYQSEEFNILGSLKDVFDEGYYFKNFISGDNGTIGSLLTLSTNIPSRPGKRFLSESKFMTTPLETGAHIPYQKRGYETTFIYGGKLSWRNIGRYFKVQGYHHIIGENKIRKDLSLTEHAGTEWGLYDEYFFDYIYNELEKSHSPQFILGLSTSNHPPFDVPKSYRPLSLSIPEKLEGRILREKELFLERFKAFQYANQSLANFITKVKSSKFGDNTIIAVTGDHNFWGFMNYEANEVYSKYRVPFFVYVPKSIKIDFFDENKLGSHEDIMATLYNLSLSDTEYLTFGEDLFSKGNSFALNASIRASDEGVMYKDQTYLWDIQRPYVIKSSGNIQLNLLDKRYRSTMAISDYYLESLLILKDNN